MIARADGTPVYHLAVVVDDADAGITHVVRGADHYSNTPKQMLIQQAMGAPTPVYGHLPLLHGPDGKKLSKRHGAASVQDLREAGYLPEAVLNYLALLGWGYDEATEFHTIDELQERFARARVQVARRLRRAEAALDERPLPARARRRRPDRPPGGAYRPVGAARRGRDLAGQDQHARRVLAARPASSSTARRTTRRPASGCSRRPAAARRWPRRGRRSSEVPEPWTEENVQAALDGVAERMGIKRKQVFQPLRVAVAGTTVSPGIFETVALLGRDETLARVDHALNGRKGT